MTHIPHLIYIFLVILVSFSIMFLFSPVFVAFLKKRQINIENKTETLDGKKAEIFVKFHAHKQGTPTMGGVLMLIVAAITITVFHFTDYNFVDRGETWLLMFTFFVSGLLGTVDDLLKSRPIWGINRLSALVRTIILFVFASVGAYWFYSKLGWSSIHIPRLGDFDIGIWYVPLFIIMIIVMANAVNITDGLDGLSGGLLIYAYLVFAVLAYAAGLFHIVGFIAMIIGILLAYVWFNVHPAMFMGGDSYSYSMGTTLGVVAIMTNSVVVLLIVGFIFFLELFSSAIQIFWKKFFGRKLIPAAPFHHTLQYLGWAESQIVMRLWIVGGMLAIAGGILGMVGMGDILK
jgi:phospho-N-acetylmuramoyl-pentapeptide-transferase